MTRHRAGKIRSGLTTEARTVAALAAVVLLLAGCGSGDDEPADAGPTDVETQAVPADQADDDATNDDDPETETPDDNDATSGPTADDLATGWVLVETTEYLLNHGQCQFLRLDGQEVVDLRAEEVSATIAVDSTGGDGADEEGDIAFRSGSTTFELDGAVSGEGTWDAVAEAGWTPLRENARIAEVGFIGTLDDGRPVTASVVCTVEW